MRPLASHPFASRCSATCVLLLLCAAISVTSPAQTFKTLLSFDRAADGSTPSGSLVQGTDGNFYGTTLVGGANNLGTVFKITPAGKLTTLYNFCSQPNCTDGKHPYLAGLVQATDGNFYGTTYNGGIDSPAFDCHGNGCGTVFKITAKGTFSTLYRFCTLSNGTICFDGNNPSSTLLLGVDGNFYGTTGGGGAFCCGTVFKISPAGTLTTLYNFCSVGDCLDGFGPQGVVLATDGNLYGTTYGGGASLQWGTVFKLASDGTLTTLYSFCTEANCADGSNPNGQLIQARNGDLYGMTWDGGGVSPCFGTVFKITLGGKLTTLHAFCGIDGSAPAGNLVQATDGNLYGITSLGGISGVGTVFKITPAGKLTTLYNFCVCAGGEQPLAGPYQGTNGLLYGTTPLGGSNPHCPYTGGCGTVFSLDNGLAPFVSLVRNAGKVGQRTDILGQGFSGTTGVWFNGTPAAYTLQSDTHLVATIPTGATTGLVTVNASSGTLTSTVPFRVIP